MAGRAIRKQSWHNLCLDIVPDAECSAPHLSKKIWQETEGAGKGWVEAPQLSCVDSSSERAPPSKIALRGKLEHQQMCLGMYKLVANKLVNGYPVWRDASDADLYIAWTKNGWTVQSESSLGTTCVWIYVPDAECSAPHLSKKIWKRLNGKG